MAQATLIVINVNIKMLLYIACKIIHKNNGIYRLIINYKILSKIVIIIWIIQRMNPNEVFQQNTGMIIM
jgi:hypothetical protein